MSNTTEDQTGRVFEIFVGEIREEWGQPEVLARDIMAKAGRTSPQGYVLEALERKNGPMVKEFTPDQTVDLREPDRKFFRITAGGGGYS